MPGLIILKRGDTLLRTCAYTVDGAAVDLTTIAIRSEVRDSAGALLAALTVTKLTQSGATLGKFTIAAAYAITELWPIGTYVFDIEYTAADGTRLSTDNVNLSVVNDITK